MKESTSFPAILYHKEHAPDGKLFQKPEHVPVDAAGWVDTPAKFDPKYQEPEPLDTDDEVGEQAAARGFVPVGYPAHLFRRGDPDNPKVVASAEAHAAIEAAEQGVWKDTYDPSAWDVAPAAPATPKGKSVKAPVDQAPTAPSAPAPAPAASVVLSDEQKAAFAKSTVSQIAEQLESVDNVAVIAALLEVEAANPKKRPSVVKALKARAAALNVPAE